MSRVVITDHNFPSIDIERGVIEQVGFQLVEVSPPCKTEEDIIGNCTDADALIVQWAPVTRRVLEALPRVKCIVRYGVGVNNFDLQAARDLGVMAANVPDFCIEEVSDHALAMILSLCRRIPQDHKGIMNGGWGVNSFRPIPALSDLTIGLVSFGKIARALGVCRSTIRYVPCKADDEERLTRRIVKIASDYGRYGYQRITALLQVDGWRVNHKRVERIWRAEGLRVPSRQPKRRLWLNDGSCVRLRPERANHVWIYDFVADRTSNGRALRILNIIDEHTRECLASVVARKIGAHDVIEVLAGLFVKRGVPEHIRSDNGPEFTARAVREWLGNLGTKTLFIEPGSPWENGYVESFNGKMRDEFLNRELFDTLLEAQVLTERWRREYNEVRPHSSLGWRPPAPAARLLHAAA